MGPPILGSATREKRTRSIASTSVAVPTVERGLAPIGSWSSSIVAVMPVSESTSGLGGVSSIPWMKAVWVALSWRVASAAIVSCTSEDLPEPDTPVKTVSPCLGMSRSTLLRLFSRAPRTRMKPDPAVSVMWNIQARGRGRADGADGAKRVRKTPKLIASGISGWLTGLEPATSWTTTRCSTN